MERLELLDYESLMRSLRQKRQRLDLEQKAVALEAGISKSHLNRMERHYTNANYRTVYDVWKILDEAEMAEKTTARELMNSPIDWASPDDLHREIRVTMKKKFYSQMPVGQESEDGKKENIGRITESILAENEDHGKPIRDLMDDPFLEIPADTGREPVRGLLMDNNPALLVTKGDEYAGIITKADLI